MTELDRRTFLKRGAALTGTLAFAGPLQAFAERAEAGRPTRSRGYGALVDKGDLALPEGFRYRIISREGWPMSDGNPTPSTFDGMAAFGRPGGPITLIRNHENKSLPGEIPVVVPPDKRYDPGVLPPALRERDPAELAPVPRGTTEFVNAGCTKLVLGRGRTVTESFAVLGGTIYNCAGGRTPWGTWITCEEFFIDGRKPHGYAFEIDARARGPVEPEPIVAAGRFEHEAVAWFDDTLYLTEDADKNASFYRYLPARRPRRAGDLARNGGRLQALRIVGRRNARTDTGFPVGRPFPVDWVTVPEPNPPADTVRLQAQARGAALFDREEGIWVGNGRVYFDCTSGGDAGAGQIWEYDPRRELITLIYESPGARQLQGPDNLVVAPTGDLFVCEDADAPQFIRGLTPDGRIYPFARSITNDSEFCGACFSPSGHTLFVNQQGSQGGGEDEAVTYAIWGPFARRAGLAAERGRRRRRRRSPRFTG